jgi:hypothetical protein
MITSVDSVICTHRHLAFVGSDSYFWLAIGFIVPNDDTRPG